MNAVDKTFEKIKNNKFIAIILVIALILLGVINFFEKILSFYDKHVESNLELVLMSLTPESEKLFADFENLSCRFDQTLIRAFASKGDRLPSSRLDLAFTFTNNGPDPVAFKSATLEVDFVQQLAGGRPGVVEPNYTYLLEIDFEVGSQSFQLSPVYSIPSSETGAFVLAFTPRSPGIGQCWIARITFETTSGPVTSEWFQMVLSRD